MGAGMLVLYACIRVGGGEANPSRSGPAADGAGLEQFQSEIELLAAHLFRGERADHTLQPTAVVNELWLKLLGTDRLRFESRAAFSAWAAQAIRHILIDHARRRNAAKRGGNAVRRLVADVEARDGVDILELADALDHLENQHPRSARVVELRFFGGMTHAEIAERLGLSVRTVRADWAMARAWLYGSLVHRGTGADPNGPDPGVPA